jgi:hypothetical protein
MLVKLNLESKEIKYDKLDAPLSLIELFLFLNY